VYCLELLEGLLVHCTTQLELSEFRGFQMLASAHVLHWPTYTMSEYFVLESGAWKDFYCWVSNKVRVKSLIKVMLKSPNAQLWDLNSDFVWYSAIEIFPSSRLQHKILWHCISRSVQHMSWSQHLKPSELWELPVEWCSAPTTPLTIQRQYTCSC